MHKLTLCTLLLMGCGRTGELPKHVPVHPKSAVFLHDISLTFKSAVQPDRPLFIRLGKEIADTGGTLAFGLLGSPDSTPQLIRQSFARLPVLPSDPVYSDQITYQDSFAMISHCNDSLINVFADACMELLRTHKTGRAWTDVNKGLERSNEFFSELKITGTNKILILNTDGKQDVVLPNGTHDHTLRLDLIPPGTQVITCGWDIPMRISGSSAVESPEGLTDQIRLLTFK